MKYDFTPSLEIDPLVDYGLDDDPPRPDQHGMERGPPGIDILAPLKTDDAVAHEQAIVRAWRWSGSSLNTRLSQIMVWIASVMASPTAVWWAAGRGTLHDQLRGRLSWALDHNNIEIDPVVYQAWRLILETQDTAPDDPLKGWDAVSSQIRKEGWSSRSLRALATATRPRLTVRRSWRHAPIPPSEVDTITLSRIGDFEVLYPKLIESVKEVPDLILSTMVATARTNLEYGAALENDISAYPSRLPTLHVENKPGEHFYSDVEDYYIKLSHLFLRFAVFDPVAAADEFRRWNGSIRFFLPLRIFAMADARMATGAEVGWEICAMSREAFWSSEHTRELLWTLRARWNCIPGRYRKAIEKRLIEGRQKHDFESDSEYSQSRATLSAARLTWMQGEGLELTADTCARLPKLKDLNHRWQDAFARSADASMESRSGWIEQKTDAMPIEDLPVSEVIARCDALAEREFASFTHYDPFRGLVRIDPQRAMNILDYEARRNNYPTRYWSRLFEEWPTDAAESCLNFIMRMGIKLPAATIVDMRYQITRWLELNYDKLKMLNNIDADKLFDIVVEILKTAGIEALRSGRGKTSVRGVEIPSNRMGVDYAINAPTGHLAEGLFLALQASNMKAKQRLPPDIRGRLESLINLPGEGGWHALTIAAQYLEWLYIVDRDWVRSFLLPYFDPSVTQSEAAWSGFLRAGHFASPGLFKELRPHFLEAFAATTRWTADGIAHLGQHLLLAIEGPPSRKPHVTAAEGRLALRSGTSQVRMEALFFLCQRATVADDWKRLVVPFFQKVWPRERQFQNAESTQRLVFFLQQSGTRFPDGVRLVADFLVASYEADVFVYQLSNAPSKDCDLVRACPKSGCDGRVGVIPRVSCCWEIRHVDGRASQAS